MRRHEYEDMQITNWISTWKIENEYMTWIYQSLTTLMNAPVRYYWNDFRTGNPDLCLQFDQIRVSTGIAIESMMRNPVRNSRADWCASFRDSYFNEARLWFLKVQPTPEPSYYEESAADRDQVSILYCVSESKRCSHLERWSGGREVNSAEESHRLTRCGGKYPLKIYSSL